MFLFFSQVFLFTMLTLFDVLALCEDEERLREWLRSYGVLSVKATKCVKCGSSMKDCVYRGKPHVVCSDQKCRAKVSDVVGGLLEGSKLSYKQFLLLVYWWAHECGGERAENMLGLSHVTVVSWSARLRQCVLNQQAAWGETLVLRTLS